MSDRPTPETDAAWSCFKGYMEPLQDVKDLSRKLERERDEAREVLKRIAHASMNARHKEEDYAEWEKAVESLQGICEEKNFINE